MATNEIYEKLTVRERQNRFFNESFKRKKVGEIDRNILSVSELCKEYQVSRSSVYKWIYKYSQMRKRENKQVIEPESETRKVLLLKQEVNELQRVIGEKQLKLDFLEKMITLAEEEYGVDIKKSLPPGPDLVLAKQAKASDENERFISRYRYQQARVSSVP